MATALSPNDDADLIQWGFNTLIASFHTYHNRPEGTSDDELRPLRDFASKVPTLHSSQVVERHGDFDSSAAAIADAGTGNAALPSAFASSSQVAPSAAPSRRKAKAVVVAAGAETQCGVATDEIESHNNGLPQQQQGPVPAPFSAVDVRPSLATSASKRGQRRKGNADNANAAPSVAAEGPTPESAASPSPEDLATWAQYYRQCAEACEQQQQTQQPKDHQQQQQALASQSQQQSQQDLLRQQQEVLEQLHQQKVLQQQVLQQLQQHQRTQQQSFLQTIPNYATPTVGAQGTITTNSPVLPAVAAGAVPTTPWPGSGFCGGAEMLSGFYGGCTGANVAPPAPPAPCLGSSFAQIPASVPASEEAFANLLMSWYLSGYYTGHYAARQGR